MSVSKLDNETCSILLVDSVHKPSTSKSAAKIKETNLILETTRVNLLRPIHAVGKQNSRLKNSMSHLYEHNEEYS